VTLHEKLAADVDAWRAMMDSVMIDPAYDGTVFTVGLADIPEKKTDLVEGRLRAARAGR